MPAGTALHPYYPLDAPIHGYVANETPLLSLLTTASVGAAALLGATLGLVSFLRPSLTRAERIAILWFVLSGTLHCFFEGYFMIHHDRMASAQDFFGQMWKEYALSDSRYMTSDTLVLCMETMTVLLWGPLCLLVAYSIFTRSSLRHPLQLTACMSHLYGDSLYYATSLYDHYVHDRPYSRPEPYYFWIYYFLMNFIWIVKPLDIGQPLGIYDTNSVRAKVRKWQQQGGGVITAEELYYDEDDENSAVESNSKPVKENDSVAGSTTTRNRSKSTPRKRVISDEHWKLNRNAARTPPPKLPPPKRIAEYTTNDQPQSSPKETDKGRVSLPSRGVEKEKTGSSELASRERRKSRASRDVDSIITSKIEEEGDSHRDSSRGASRPGSADKAKLASKSDLSERTSKKETTTGDDAEWADSDADFSELSRRRAKGPEQNPSPKNRAPLKPPKGGIFGHMLDESRKMFAKPESPKPIPNNGRGSKIEAWLSGTSDPFMDMDPDVEVPAPLNTKTNRAKQSPKSEQSRDRAMDTDPESDSRRKSTSKRRVKSRDDSTTSSERAKRMTEEITSSKDSKGSHRDGSSSSGRKSTEHKHSRSSSSAKDKTSRDKPSTEKEEPSDVQAPLSNGSEVSGNNPPVPVHRKRPIPSTGLRRLSTIESLDSLSTSEGDPEERDQFDPNSLPVVSTQLKRRLTTHDDLISVLSSSNGRSRSIRSARSIRSNKSRIMNATIPDLLKEMSADEVKYMRELKTLVGGVIPVLLTCVLSRSDSAIAAGLFHPSMDPTDEANFTKPIVNMGVAVERLKTLHKRIPEENADSLLTWAHGAQRVYREYLKAWRLGFKDVIVNLAPLEEGEAAENADTKSLDEGMARDENGDVIDSDGEKVDVAYLLKRPLVRLKYLAKTFKGISMLQPSEKAEEVATAYQSLVTDARRRAREERARLEDESAACIDASRARDPATLGPLAEVKIEKGRRVRARDFFNLSLYHSSGQVIDCRAEFLLRDYDSDNGTGGDLLICEIDHADRWLLFPPMDLAFVSARNGDAKGELVVMLRSGPGHSKPWQELLILRIDEEDIGFEWVQMLGLNPVPPTISRSQSFIERAKQRQRAQTVSANDDASAQNPPTSPTGMDVPIGEKANGRSLRRSSPREQLSDPSTVGSSLATESRMSINTAITRESDYSLAEPSSAKPSPQSQPSILHARDPRKIGTSDDRSPTGLKRSKAKRVAHKDEDAPPSPGLAKETIAEHDRSGTSSPYRPAPSTPHRHPEDSGRSEQQTKIHKEQYAPETPTRDPPESSSRVSSVPSMDLPSIPKLRQGSSQSYISDSVEYLSDEEDYVPIESPTRSKRKGHSRSNSDSSDQGSGEAPPAPPPHSRSPSSTGSSLPNTPILSPGGARPRRRGSSPLKHEYEPSTASDTYSDSDTSTVRRYDLYSESDYSASDSSDDESEDELSSMPPAKARDMANLAAQDSLITSATSSLSPSNSVSQGGYRTVPSQPEKSTTALASVFAWSDKGSWDNVLPDDCRIIVSPGLIEAYDMKDAGVDGEDMPSKKVRPVIALELTPLVPIRRGTAIDISIRSPPTERSKVAWSNNIMFRSRNADECEALYSLINHARINNPTYIALQNARGPLADQPVNMEPQNKSGGLFGWPRRRRSYRASASPRSLADNSESSVGTMSSAFSALKRFGAGSKMFSISRSSVTSRSRKNEDSLYSSSAASNHSPNSGLGRIAAAIKGVDGIGLSNAKIRLYVRETQSKWRDMGAARLTIMPSTPEEPPRPETAMGGQSDALDAGEGADDSPPGSGSATPRRGVESEKRILVQGKTRNEVLLDVCLPESSFERVARTGIAVSVWEETEGGAMPKKGGVTGGFSRIYMIQMKSEAEAAYTFGLVGKLRY
ncbi:EBP-domain-containing protein [Aspergillus steynii IBT 23096]|uniref:EBP-domain-containing protein n=1 Tax=Aspergillus steynii IBT 23096 TaxID=1392250 RepID=A0A2I2G5L4_9EURO|nr:EBP-domain-containing protein [Aspergillus steynii IBT 23096]PLB48167.1 EBP-domain-containing protein [Aspergillus steynii IBT 23096]